MVCKGTNKREQYKTKNLFLFLLSSGSTFERSSKLRISERNAKFI